MSGLEDLERRVAALEERLRVMPGAQVGDYRDLGSMASALQAQQHNVQALAIAQLHHNEMLSRLEKSLTTVRGELDRITTMLGRLLDEPDGS